jgi:hypothetical protein
VAKPPIYISNIRTERGDKTSRILADVDNTTVWFERDDPDIPHCPEIFACAFVYPAMIAGRDLAFDEPLDAEWLDNIPRVIDKFRKWWRLSDIRVLAERADPVSLPQREKTGQVFTGGVDSFHTLLRGPDKIDHLVYVHGMDVDIEDTERGERMREALKDISQTLGIDYSFIGTNIYHHPLLLNKNLIRQLGGSLSAAGHAVHDKIGKLIINSSTVLSFDVPYGTHWDTDPYWSSSKIEIVHGVTHLWRKDKLVEIIDEPLAQKHLHVCWGRMRPGFNCGICEKCLRTMIMINQHGKLDKFETFDPDIDIVTELDNSPPLWLTRLKTYSFYIENEKDENIRRAMQRLVRRTRSPVNLARLVLRRIGRILNKTTQDL